MAENPLEQPSTIVPDRVAYSELRDSRAIKAFMDAAADGHNGVVVDAPEKPFGQIQSEAKKLATRALDVVQKRDGGSYRRIDAQARIVRGGVSTGFPKNGLIYLVGDGFLGVIRWELEHGDLDAESRELLAAVVEDAKVFCGEVS